MPSTTAEHSVLTADEGIRLQSGPGRDLVFKVTGEDTGGALDYFTVEVAPKAAERRSRPSGHRECVRTRTPGPAQGSALARGVRRVRA
jgi:uncharacterized protein YcgI (DUF1989 family)